MASYLPTENPLLMSSSTLGLLQYEAAAWQEVATHNVLMLVLHRGGCDERNGTTPLVLQAGANDGFYGMTAAVSGCRVVMIEPQPKCYHDLLLSAVFTPVAHTPVIYNRVITPDSPSITVDVPLGMCSGITQYTRNGVGWVDTLDSPLDPTATRVPIASIRIDDVVDEDVELFLSDVEGAEMGVMASAMRLFRTHRVNNVVMELKQWQWFKYNNNNSQPFLEAAELQQWKCCQLTSTDVLSLPMFSMPELANEFNKWSSVDMWCVRKDFTLRF